MNYGEISFGEISYGKTCQGAFMGIFIGRTEELHALRSKAADTEFKMAVIYGRRRVGKTTLVNHFINDSGCRAISFMAVETGEQELIRMMSNEVVSALTPDMAEIITLDSFEKIFDYVAKLAVHERIIFFIDEYPYLAKQCPYMNSLLQKYIDTVFKKTQLYLILCGSMMGSMQDEVLSSSSPLHGRSDLELKIQPFNYLETAQFMPDYTNEEKAVVYGLTSGVAKYIEQFDPKIPLEENISSQFFNNTGYFTEEQIKTIVTGDKKNPAVYNSIIAAIANSHTKYNDISSTVGIDDISYYLNNLCVSGIIEKRVSKKPYYVLSDSMLAFWFRYVRNALSLINAGRGALYYERNVKGKMHEYMGAVFESMAKQYIYKNMGTDELPVFVTDLSEYQSGIKENNEVKHIEIDILGTLNKDIILVGECKFKNELFGKDEYDSFMDKIKYIRTNDPVRILFSLNGFSAWVEEQADKDSRLILVGIDKMFTEKH